MHASAHGLRLTLAPTRDPASFAIIGGSSDTGLAQPAQAPLNALLDVTAGIVLHGGHPNDETTFLNLAALGDLRNRTMRLLGQAETDAAG